MRAASPFRSPSRLQSRPVVALLAAFGVLAFTPDLALAGPEPVPVPRASTPTPTLQDLIAEASRRFGVPAPWIAEVMAVESRGHAQALSPKGAIGLMQVMPETYADMRARYGQGANPWKPRDNVLAGTAYLRLLYDRYGTPGFLVAYNAGPGRWDDYRLRARPLPAETVAYLARLGPVAGGSVLPLPTFAGWSARRSPLAAPIFVSLGSTAALARTATERARIVRVIEANASIAGRSDAIFVTRPGAVGAQSDTPSDGEQTADRPAPGRASPVVPAPPQAPRNELFPARDAAGSRR